MTPSPIKNSFRSLPRPEKSSNRLPLLSKLQAVAGALAVLAVLAGIYALSSPARAAEVEVFSPQMQAKGVRQVTARFSDPMVAFGDPRLADPFNVQCDGDAARLKGRGRWADARNWVYDF